jgi:hypothetical protein
MPTDCTQADDDAIALSDLILDLMPARRGLPEQFERLLHTSASRCEPGERRRRVVDVVLGDTLIGWLGLGPQQER